MKQINLYIIVGLVAFFTGVKTFAQETVTAKPANDFLNSIGTNTSINERNEKFNTTKTCLEYIGMRWIRTGPPGSNVRPAHFEELYKDLGIRFAMTLPPEGDTSGNPENSTYYPGGIQHTIDGAKKVIDRVGTNDIIIGFEGPNEPNNWAITYQGKKGAGSGSYNALARYQRDFYAAVKADEVVGHISVWSSTDAGGAQSNNVGLQFLEIPATAVGVDPEFPAGTKFADVACVHNYFSRSARVNNQTWSTAGIAGNNCLKDNFGTTWSKGFQGYTNEQLEQLPKVTTETGITIEGYTREIDQARLFLSCYLAQYARGFKYTAMYLLRDRTDEGGNQTFGFYQPNYQPRLGAHYMHNMTSILADKVSATDLKQLTYTIASKPTTVHELLLQKENGTMYLIVWGEKYAQGTTADNITVQFDKTFGTINVYNPGQYEEADPEIGKRPIATYNDVSSIPLTIQNTPFIFEFDPPTNGINSVKNKTTTSIYPNLVENILYIQNGDTGIDKAEIFDLTGKNVLLTGKLATPSIDVTQLQKGMYIVRLTTTDKKVENHQFIKM